MENLLVKVGKFIFPAGFTIMDINEDEEIPIILGQSILNTGGTLIDVRERKLTWRLGDEEEVFKVFGTVKSSFSPPSYNYKSLTRWKSLWLSLTQVWGRKTLPGTKSFQKTLDGVRTREITSPFMLLALEWVIIPKDRCKKVVDSLPFFHPSGSGC